MRPGFREIKRTDAGAVTEITIGGVTLTGGEVRTLFSLRSQNFTLAFDNGMAVLMFADGAMALV